MANKHMSLVIREMQNRCSNNNLYKNVHSSTTCKSQKLKQYKCPSADEWTNKMWYIHTTDYYFAIKNNEVLTHATTWMNLENILLSERSQTPKATYYMVPFI